MYEAEVDVTKLQVIGPYHLQSTVQILSNTYKCQIYVFNGITNTKKLFKIQLTFTALYNTSQKLYNFLHDKPF